MNVLTQRHAASLINKVPQVTFFFWLIKIMATTVGETAADFLIFNLKIGLPGVTALMTLLLVVVLFFQMKARQYKPWIYWLAVVSISIVGTLITDGLVDNVGVPLELTTGLFSLALLATFAGWYASEKTLAITMINTARREWFYWAAILFTFALGTAAGDLTAEGLNLGYAWSALVFGLLIAAVAIARYVFNLNAVLAFWTAYVLTRPFGASCGDLLSQPLTNGGLGLGTVVTSLVFLVAILALVSYLTITRKDTLVQ